VKWQHRKKDPEFVTGDHNVIDDYTGFKVKASTLKPQWDGFRTQASNLSERHPQDFIRATKERIGTPWNRSPQPEVFMNQDAIVTNGTFIADTDWEKGSSWGIANGYATYTAGSTDTLYQSVNAVSGKIYEVVYTVFNYVGAGSITASLGTTSGTARTGNGEFSEKITSGGANADRLTFTPGAGGTSFNIDFVRVLRVG